MKVIEITVDAEGRATVQTRGFAGAECRDASRLVERALGRATAERLTAEFYQAQPARTGLEQSTGP